MYLEVPFINGYTEFLEIYSKNIIITKDNVSTEFKYELSDKEVLPESITYFSNEGEAYLNIRYEKEDDISFLVIKPLTIIPKLNITVQYSYRNIEPKNMYSVDYNLGVVYFSEPTDKELLIEYESDRILLVGKKAHQLDNTQYSYIDGKVNINNFKDNSSIYFVYTKNKNIKRNISPVLQDLKLNYITMDPRSL